MSFPQDDPRENSVLDSYIWGEFCMRTYDDERFNDMSNYGIFVKNPLNYDNKMAVILHKAMQKYQSIKLDMPLSTYIYGLFGDP